MQKKTDRCSTCPTSILLGSTKRKPCFPSLSERVTHACFRSCQTPQEGHQGPDPGDPEGRTSQQTPENRGVNNRARLSLAF